MKKMIKKSFILICVLSVLLLNCFVMADTTAPSSFVVNGKDTYSIDGSEYLVVNGINLGYKQTSDGEPIYCLEIDKAYVTDENISVTFYLVNELSPKHAYVLTNGYPNKSITGDDKKDYYITALTIWYLENPNHNTFTYFDLENGTYSDLENDVVKEMSKLIKGANNYSYTEPTIKTNISSNNLTLSNDNKYFTSSSIGVTTTGTVENYKVSLENAPSGTMITDTNGNEKTEFETNEKFIVKVPVSSIETLSSEFKVNISATGSIYKAYSYSSGISEYQAVVALYPENKSITTNTTLKINSTTEAQISKIDITTKKELPGATLTVKDSEGNVVETWVSTNEVHIIKELKEGKYTLTEEIAPDGYELSETTIEFVIGENGKVYIDDEEMQNNLIVMGNTPEPEQVETGSTIIYVATTLGILSLGVIVFLVIKNKKKV